MANFVVILDANVLYGIEVTELLLTMATRRLFRSHWSPQILDEVRRNLDLRDDLEISAIDRRIAVRLGTRRDEEDAARFEDPVFAGFSCIYRHRTDSDGR